MLKAAGGAELAAAVHTVHAGHRYLSPRVVDQVVEPLLPSDPTSEPNGALACLTERERDVLGLIADGKSTGEIADTRSLSRSTVNTYGSRTMQKLGIDSLVGLAKVGVKHGLAPLE